MRLLDWAVVGISLTFLAFNLKLKDRAPVLSPAVASEFGYVRDDAPLSRMDLIPAAPGGQALGGFESAMKADQATSLTFGYVRAADVDRLDALTFSPSGQRARLN